LFGVGVGFFVAAYTGVLLAATNQPVWSDSPWISALFLTSAASTGIATLIVLAHLRSTIGEGTRERLERADLYVVVLELAAFAARVASLDETLGTVARLPHGRWLLVSSALLGILVPLGIQASIRLRRSDRSRRRAVAGAVVALVGGLVLRYAILAVPPELLK